MATLSAAGYNALPWMQRNGWRPDGNGSFTNDPTAAPNPLHGYDAATNTYKNIPGAGYGPQPNIQPSTSQTATNQSNAAPRQAMASLQAPPQPVDDRADRARQDAADSLAQRNLEESRRTSTVQANADRTAREQAAAREAGLTSTSEANRLATANADRVSAEQLAARAQAGHLTALEASGTIADRNAANASARSQAARDKTISQIPGLMTSFTGDPGGTPGGGASGAAPTGGVDPQAARDMAFARSKDKIGQIQRGAMTSLREGFASRGLAGGGQEGNAMASLVGEGQGQLSDVVTGQMGADLDYQNKIADRNYAGALTKRGQDTGIKQSILSLLGSSAY